MDRLGLGGTGIDGTHLSGKGPHRMVQSWMSTDRMASRGIGPDGVDLFAMGPDITDLSMMGPLLFDTGDGPKGWHFTMLPLKKLPHYIVNLPQHGIVRQLHRMNTGSTLN